MTIRIRSLPRLVLREALSARSVLRQPEPTMQMADPAAVAAFHREGSGSGCFLPVYHFNALGVSRLAPPGATVLDLGSGSGQYLAYLGQRRPDLRIVGLDISPEMIRVGRDTLKRLGLNDRIELRQGDMTDFRTAMPDRVDLISSVFALHHLPTSEDLDRCLAEIAAVRRHHGCGLWLFDHARPRHPRTPEAFPETFEAGTPKAFRDDSRDSLLASWTCEEVTTGLARVGVKAMTHVCSRVMSVYQVHWSTHPRPSLEGHQLWRDSRLPLAAAYQFRAFKGIYFPNVPLAVRAEAKEPAVGGGELDRSRLED